MLTWTSRVVPIIQIGVGDQRNPLGTSRWDVATWNGVTSTWSGQEPTWFDVSCSVQQLNIDMGRLRATERFKAGRAEVVLENESGWADPRPAPAIPDTGAPVLSVRPGRQLRIGFQHDTLGMIWLYRGYIDVMEPLYSAADTDSVRFECIDALGEVNRVRLPGLAAPVGANESAAERVTRILDAAAWSSKRTIRPSGTALVGTRLQGQTADLLGIAADSSGGIVYGDIEANIVYRNRDWQAYGPGAPDATIGNVDSTDVCPVGWRRPYARANIVTRVLLGRSTDADADPVVPPLQLDDTIGQTLFGIETYERRDLDTRDAADIEALGDRLLTVLGHESAPRSMTAILDARTTDEALDVAATCSLFRPSRYRARLVEHGSLVFDDEYFATGVRHEITPQGWTVEINMDLASSFETLGGRWDGTTWGVGTWASL